MTRIRVALALVCTLSTASIASATPLTLNFTGQWQHYDPQSHTPGFWAAMASLGIVNGTRAAFSFTIDDTAAGSNAATGVFAVTSWSLQLGTYTFGNMARPYSLSASGFWGPSSGPTLGGLYKPGFMQFGLGTTGLPVFGGLTAISHASWANTLLYFDFSSPFSRNGGTMLLQRSIPGPGTLPLVLSGVVGLLWLRRKRRLDARDLTAN
jgi:hypothetical protein